MNELQAYFEAVLKVTTDMCNSAQKLAELTLLIQGYEQGKEMAKSSPFKPQTAQTEQSGEFPTAPLIAATGLAESQDGKIKGSYIVPEKKTTKWSVLLLTEKEIQRMPKQFRKDFRVGRIVAHVRKKDNGVYEIQCQINYQKIYASSKFLDVAKEQFTERLIDYAANVAVMRRTEKRVVAEKLTQPPVIEPVEPETPKSVTLGEYMLKWLETVKKPTIKEISYRQYIVYYKAITPVFGDKPLNEIKPLEVQAFINTLVDEGKNTMAKQCRTILSALFEYAVIDDIITKSPMLKVAAPHVEPKEGVPLSREEEKALIALMFKKHNIHVQACVFMLYTGLRRAELASVQIKDGWVHLISAKGRKGYKVKSRAVPISPMLAPLLPYMDIEGIKNVKLDTLTSAADKIIPSHHCHELRHTFITRCQECGIRREIVSLWAGHAADSSITSQVYTHLQTNKEIQLEEIKKFDYKL